ncbi:translation elongation factor 4 [Brachybacterium sp. GPGPB12]|uniref:translation elongation factor 4 n=1 Tax=Brachybacterium sp. GPGPB12 TaxID=3023517 RepID=UPI0031342353
MPVTPRIAADEARDIAPASTPQERLRNFCIIAHIDHGKSTLADRMPQITGIVEERAMRAQYLDRMDIERERGITVKSQAVRMPWQVEGVNYALNMIDTPGHVDFTYEVSRSLAACEGAILLVDAAQGIEAQTLANLYLAMEHDLTIIPVLNKIDLPGAEPEKYAAEIGQLVGVDPEDVSRVSGKTGVGVPESLDHVVRTLPAPEGQVDAPCRAMIFDSVYDTYRGVVTYVRVVDGFLKARDRIDMMSTGAHHEPLEIGVSSPEPHPTQGIGPGEVGYLITGVKDVRQSKVGDTITTSVRGATEPLAGYSDPKPMVYSGLFPIDGSDYPVAARRAGQAQAQRRRARLRAGDLHRARLRLPRRLPGPALHLEIIRERLEREFDLDLISTAPSVVYQVVMEDGTEIEVLNPSDFPEGKVNQISEPVASATILVPSEFIGAVMELCQSKRGTLGGMDYLSEDRVERATPCRWRRSSSTSSTS